MNAYVCDHCGYDGFRAKFRGTIDFAPMVFCPLCSHELRRQDDSLAAFEPDRGRTFAEFLHEGEA